MGQHLMICPECGMSRDFIEKRPSDICLYCGHSYIEEHKLTVEQEASQRLAPHLLCVLESTATKEGLTE